MVNLVLEQVRQQTQTALVLGRVPGDGHGPAQVRIAHLLAVGDQASIDMGLLTHEVGGQGVWRGKSGVRRWLETMGPAGLSHGQVNDRVQFDVTVTISGLGSVSASFSG